MYIDTNAKTKEGSGKGSYRGGGEKQIRNLCASAQERGNKSTNLWVWGSKHQFLFIENLSNLMTCVSILLYQYFNVILLVSLFFFLSLSPFFVLWVFFCNFSRLQLCPPFFHSFLVRYCFIAFYISSHFASVFCKYNISVSVCSAS